MTHSGTFLPVENYKKARSELKKKIICGVFAVLSHCFCLSSPLRELSASSLHLKGIRVLVGLPNKESVFLQWSPAPNGT